jgi:hypothetical protein
MLIRKKEEFYKDTEFLKTSNKLWNWKLYKSIEKP